jgi:predicted AAA+ superfamily ATPase
MDRIIKTMLQEWKEKELPTILDREISLKDYLNLKLNKIIVLTGFRRVGKTYLILGLIKEMLKTKTKEEAVYLNFEDERIPLRTEFLTGIIPSLKEFYSKKTEFLFLDEVQNIPEWSKWLRRIHDNEKIRIFVTGSTSKTSSKEIPTELRGRFLEVRVFPLSFKEFLGFKDIRFDIKSLEYSSEQKSAFKRAFEEYLVYGGLPEIVLSDENRKKEISQSYYQTVLRRDIAERYNIKNDESLKALLLLLLNSTHYSISKLYDNLKGMNYEVGKTTVQNYVSYIENSYFMLSLPIFSYKIKNRMQYQRKPYFIDNIFINSLSTQFSKNYGRLYENLVAISLFRKYEEVFYWKNMQNEEVDFVIKDGAKVKQLIQVCYNIDNLETKKREVKAILKASKELKCTNLLIITNDYESEEEQEWFGIKAKVKFVQLWKWLLL